MSLLSKVIAVLLLVLMLGACGPPPEPEGPAARGVCKSHCAQWVVPRRCRRDCAVLGPRGRCLEMGPPCRRCLRYVTACP